MKKILIVDDEVDVLMVLEKRLTAVGFEVIKSSDGNTAVQMAQQHHPDLIIMDVNMPIMDGGEAGYLIRNNLTTKDIPIIFLTALIARHEEKDRTVLSKRYFFISKPYDAEELITQINMILKLSDS